MGAEYGRRLRVALLCCLTCALCGGRPANATEKGASLPDWSGWWTLSERFQDEWKTAPPPLKAADLAHFRESRADDSNPDPGRFCRPPQFTGYSGGFTESVEFLFTPGRVTLTNEAGLIRRIYTDGRPLPAEHEFSNAGTSVGHWEGQALVIETVNIAPGALWPLSTTHGALPIGKDAKVTERISLEAPNRLRFEVVTVAPELLTAPDKRTRVYTRVPGKYTAREFNVCVKNDRSIDPTTGKQRFDLTPPADLPAPPPRSP